MAGLEGVWDGDGVADRVVVGCRIVPLSEKCVYNYCKNQNFAIPL